ncbi:MAG: hypothetical protein HY541_08555 [Deltaproteobacteria bacterium]|nr:hypothetical protein [Deltaproteobacteria bacterium]
MKTREFLLCLSVVFLGHFLFAKNADAAVIQVNTFSDEPFNNGNYVADGDCTLSEAIKAANYNMAVDACPAGSDADTIQIPAGTYSLEYQKNSDQEIALPLIWSQMTLVGLGSSPAQTVITRSTTASPMQLIYCNPSSNLTLENLTLSGGEATVGFTVVGGAIYNSSGPLTLNNVVVSDNTSSGDGGGLYNLSGLATITDSVFSQNQSTNSQGGAINNDGSLVINGSSFTANSAKGGGAIYTNGNISVTNSIFTGNNGSIGTSTAGVRFGGAIYANVASIHTISIVKSTFSGNSAKNGGALYLKGGTILINRTAIHGNSVTNIPYALGGGISIYSISMSEPPTNVGIWNSTIADNTVPDSSALGGGIYVDYLSALSLTNVTLAGNSAGFGGGIYIGGSSQVPQIKNSILSGNQAFNDPASNDDGPNCAGYTNSSGNNLVSLGYNFIDDDSCNLSSATGDQTNISGLLGNFQENSAEAGSGHYLLAVISPAINGGDPSGCADPDGNSTDQLSRNRVGFCDAGAVEWTCANGVVDAFETCDDGNSDSGDGCSSTCQTESSEEVAPPPEESDPSSAPTTDTPVVDTPADSTLPSPDSPVDSMLPFDSTIDTSTDTASADTLTGDDTLATELGSGDAESGGETAPAPIGEEDDSGDETEIAADGEDDDGDAIIDTAPTPGSPASGGGCQLMVDQTTGTANPWQGVLIGLMIFILMRLNLGEKRGRNFEEKVHF